MSTTDKIIIEKVKKWLEDNNKSEKWLANEIGVSSSLIKCILTGQRRFLPNRIIQVSKLMGISVKELISNGVIKEKDYVLQVRGTANSRVAKDDIRNMMFAIEDYINIKRANVNATKG